MPPDRRHPQRLCRARHRQRPGDQGVRPTPLAALLAGTAIALMAAADTASAADWSTAQKITVAATEYQFDPKSLTFHVGTAYRLRVVNKGKETHEFTAPEFFRSI